MSQDDRPPPDTGRCPGPGSPQPDACSSAPSEQPQITDVSRAAGRQGGGWGWHPSRPTANSSVIHPPQPLQNNLISLEELLAACQGGAPEEGPTEPPEERPPTRQGGAVIRQENPSTSALRNAPSPHPEDLPFRGSAGSRSPTT